MTQSADDSQRLIDSVIQAVASKKSISIIGHGSKAHYARSSEGDALQSADHVGIVAYQPEELVISARAGTPLADIEATLDEKNQMLACDPPQFLGKGTIGGAVASGLCGPGRPWYGNLRDAVLGIEMVNGRGERLTFGGSVMKNVAGFDVSRLMVGSLGIFGVILSVNLRVHPKPEVERTIALDIDWDDAWQILGDTIAKPSAVTATCYWSDTLYLRLSGNRASVMEACAKFPNAEELENDLWVRLRDHSHPFFRRRTELQRTWLSRGVQAKITEDRGPLVEWAGSQVWSHRPHSDARVVDEDSASEPFDRVEAGPATESKYVKRLRRAFDPLLLFNCDLRL